MIKTRTRKASGNVLASSRGAAIVDTARNPQPHTKSTVRTRAADRFIAASQSPATKRAYESDLRHFLQNGGSIPSSPAHLAEYLARFADRLSVATLERRLTAIQQAHRNKNLPSPCRSDAVKRVMQGIRRTLGTKQRQAAPLVRDDLLAALVMVDRQSRVKAARDRALLLVGFASAMRRSELVSIKIEHLTRLSNGLEIFLPISKTDQHKRGRTVFIPLARDKSHCPVRSLLKWINLAGISDGHVFRAVTRHEHIANHGLSAQSVALVVKSAVARAGGNAKRVSGHSLRSGYCTSAAEDGLQPWQIREQTGHKSDVTLAKYIRPVARNKIPGLL